MTSRIQIVSGGVPSDEELAAVVVALTPVAGGDVAEEPVTRPPSPWRQAAIVEGVGGRPVSSAADLTARRVPGA